MSDDYKIVLSKTDEGYGVTFQFPSFGSALSTALNAYVKALKKLEEGDYDSVKLTTDYTLPQDEQNLIELLGSELPQAAILRTRIREENLEERLGLVQEKEKPTEAPLPADDLPF